MATAYHARECREAGAVHRVRITVGRGNSGRAAPSVATLQPFGRKKAQKTKKDSALTGAGEGGDFCVTNFQLRTSNAAKGRLTCLRCSAQRCRPSLQLNLQGSCAGRFRLFAWGIVFFTPRGRRSSRECLRFPLGELPRSGGEEQHRRREGNFLEREAPDLGPEVRKFGSSALPARIGPRETIAAEKYSRTSCGESPRV